MVRQLRFIEGNAVRQHELPGGKTGFFAVDYTPTGKHKGLVLLDHHLDQGEHPTATHAAVNFIEEHDLAGKRKYGGRPVTINAMDADSLLGAFALMHPERARPHLDAIRNAAHQGDHLHVPGANPEAREHAMKVNYAITGMIHNFANEQFAKKLHQLTPEEKQSIAESVIGHLPRLLENPEAYSKHYEGTLGFIQKGMEAKKQVSNLDGITHIQTAQYIHPVAAYDAARETQPANDVVLRQWAHNGEAHGYELGIRPGRPSQFKAGTLYKALNDAEAKARKTANSPWERSVDPWGGREVAGGSPRTAGSALTPKQVANIIRRHMA